VHGRRGLRRERHRGRRGIGGEPSFRHRPVERRALLRARPHHRGVAEMARGVGRQGTEREAQRAAVPGDGGIGGGDSVQARRPRHEAEAFGEHVHDGEQAQGRGARLGRDLERVSHDIAGPGGVPVRALVQGEAEGNDVGRDPGGGGGGAAGGREIPRGRDRAQGGWRQLEGDRDHGGGAGGEVGEVEDQPPPRHVHRAGVGERIPGGARHRGRARVRRQRPRRRERQHELGAGDGGLAARRGAGFERHGIPGMHAPRRLERQRQRSGAGAAQDGRLHGVRAHEQRDVRLPLGDAAQVATFTTSTGAVSRSSSRTGSAAGSGAGSASAARQARARSARRSRTRARARHMDARTPRPPDTWSPVLARCGVEGGEVMRRAAPLARRRPGRSS
jgi:hypothetical protein